MQIPSEYLEVKNYDGSRLIEIEDETVSKLHAEKVATITAEKFNELINNGTLKKI